MRDYLIVAVEAARLGGDILKKSYGRVKEIKFKGEIDIVTDVDKKSEQEIVDLLSSQFPQHAILAEEGTVRDKNSDFKWVIDPLDGTTNYAHGYPVFCVSIALERNKDIIIGAIYQPMHDELFVAEKGGGAFRNGKKIQVSRISKLKQALIATGFSPDIVAEPEEALDVFGNLVTNIYRRAFERLAKSGGIDIWVGGHSVERLVETYAEIGDDEVCALFGSTDHLEIAANTDSAVERLGLKEGAVVRVSRR